MCGHQQLTPILMCRCVQHGGFAMHLPMFQCAPLDHDHGLQGTQFTRCCPSWLMRADRPLSPITNEGTESVNNRRHDKNIDPRRSAPSRSLLHTQAGRRPARAFKHRLGYGCLFLTMRRHEPTSKLMRRTYVGARHTPGAHAGRGGVANQTDDRQPQAKVDCCGSQRSR